MHMVSCFLANEKLKRPGSGYLLIAHSISGVMTNSAQMGFTDFKLPYEK
jgi:hypothetical protein